MAKTAATKGFGTSVTVLVGATPTLIGELLAVTGYRVRLATCQSSVDALTLSLEHQNAAVDRLKAEGDERTRRANAAIQAAQKEARTYRAKADRIARAKPTGDLCEAAQTLIVEIGVTPHQPVAEGIAIGKSASATLRRRGA